MAERIPPLNIEVTSTFDKKGFEQAERAVGRLDKSTVRNADAQQKKVKELREAYSLLSKSVSGDNKKVSSALKNSKKALDAIDDAEKKLQKARDKRDSSVQDTLKKSNIFKNAESNYNLWRSKLFSKQTKSGNKLYSERTNPKTGEVYIGKRSERARGYKKDPIANEEYAKRLRIIQNAQISYNQAVKDADNALADVVNSENAYNDSINNAQQSLQAAIDVQKQENQILDEKEAKEKIAKRNKALKAGFKTTVSIFKNAYNAIKGINFTQILAKVYSFTTVAKKLNSFIEASSEWIENLNLLEVVYNDTADSADNVKERIADLSKQFRMDINALAKYVSTFKQMANAMGQVEEVGTQMAETLSLIALDIASLRNVDVETAVSDLTGALAGQVKPVRKYGFDITMYSIEELMKEAGYSGNARTMNQSNKQLARAILLIRQSKDAWGDFSKTINTYANQQRVLNDQITQFKRLLGSLLLGSFEATDSFEEASKTAGLFQKGIWYINGALIAANTVLEAIVPKINAFNGAIAAGSDEAVDALEEEEEALNGALASFDKFNALQESKGNDSGASSALEKMFSQESSKYMEEFQERLSTINMYAETIADTILKMLYPEYGAWKGSDTEKTFQQWVEQGGDAKLTAKSLEETILSLVEVVAWAASPLLGLFATLSKEMLLATGDEQQEKMQEMIDLIDSMTSVVTTLAGSLVELAKLFTPVAQFFANFLALCANSPATLAMLTAGVFGLYASFALLKSIMTMPEPTAALIKATKIIAISSAALVGTAAIGGAIAGAVQKHADGGFQTGGFFLAGESGPEWVGRQGNTATILNDNQMSDIMMDSVAKGVIKANIASRQMGGGRSQRGGKIAVVNLNGKHLFDVVEEEGQKEGKVFATSR